MTISLRCPPTSASCPRMYKNTYIQHENGALGLYGSNAESSPRELAFDSFADKTVEQILGERDAKVYVLADRVTEK